MNQLPEEADDQRTGERDSLADDDLVGTTLINTYRILRVVGEGGTGRVYEAQHARIPTRRFAVKVLHPEFIRHPEAVVRFPRAAEAAAAITHPNVVGVYDLDRVEDGRPFLVSELVEGIELASHVERIGRLTAHQIVPIARQICSALEAAHEKRVVHRDVKPQNIILTGDPAAPRAMVLDFGLSRLDDGPNTAVTRTGAILGTPAYMAPEQAQGKRADHRVDIYGVGTILYCGLTGQPPFQRESVEQTVLAVMTAEPTRPRALEPTIDDSLEMIIQRAMARDPNDRYQTMAELGAALAAYEQAALVTPAAAADEGPRGERAADPLRVESQLARSARPGLVLFAFVAALCLLAAVAAAVAGVASTASPRGITQNELVLVLLAVIGTALTPALLGVRRVRRRVWNNSAKVVALLPRLWWPLLAALGAYGLAALGVGLFDQVVRRFGAWTILTDTSGDRWAAWPAFYLLIALIVASATVIGQRQLRAERPLPRNLGILLPALAALALCAATFYLGLAWRKGVVSEEQVAPVAGVAAVGSEDAPPGQSAPSARAPGDELAAAIARGVEGLTELADKHPDDPDVMRALALAHGRTSKGRPLALAALDRLFQLAPERADDSDLRKLLVTIAQGKEPEQASAALELMANRMGRAGPDILYELMIGDKDLRPRIKDILGTPAVRERLSPALEIAYALQIADSCAARVPLLDRASQLGDERAMAVLGSLSASKKTGCGRWKRSPCPAACPAEAKAFSKAAQQIHARLTRKPAGP